jgi:hypothetical protein
MSVSYWCSSTIFSPRPAGWSPASSCHSGTSSYTQSRFYTPRLLAFHCFLCDHLSCVQVELIRSRRRRASPPSCVWSPLARQSSSPLLVCGSSSLYCVWEQPLPFDAPARLWRLVYTATATGGVGFGGGGATGSGRRCRCGSRRAAAAPAAEADVGA